MEKRGGKEEDIYNFPNFLSLFRLIFSPIFVCLVFLDAKLLTIVSTFVILALTDALDGEYARKFNRVTDFGRRLDIIADRVLMISIVVAMFLYASTNHLLTFKKEMMVVAIMSREIISLPYFVIAFLFAKRPIPHARTSGKATTILQGISFPIILLGWNFAIILAVITSAMGIISAGYYIYDAIINPNNKIQKELDKYYKAL